MNIIQLPISEPAVLIKNFFNEEEKKLIEEEICFLCKPYKLLTPQDTHAAQYQNDDYKKKGVGVFLDEVYKLRHCSNILNITRKYFDPALRNDLEKIDSIFKYIKNTNHDHTLLNYYHQGDWYKPHDDTSVFTIITFFWYEPKCFSGGQLKFTEHEYDTNVSPWDVIIFPSYITHEVTELNIVSNTSTNKLNGRISLTTFASIG